MKSFIAANGRAYTAADIEPIVERLLVAIEPTTMDASDVVLERCAQQLVAILKELELDAWDWNDLAFALLSPERYALAELNPTFLETWAEHPSDDDDDDGELVGAVPSMR